MKKTYTINGKNYSQSPLVIGQLSNLLKELKGVTFTNFSPLGLISAFGETMPRLLACVLVPSEQTPKDVDIDALANELWETPTDTVLAVVTDFLEVTGPASLMAKVEEMIAKVVKGMKAAGPQDSAPASLEETP